MGSPSMQKASFSQRNGSEAASFAKTLTVRIDRYFNSSQANVVNRVWRSESHRHIRDLSRNVEGSANQAVRLRSASSP